MVRGFWLGVLGCGVGGCWLLLSGLLLTPSGLVGGRCGGGGVVLVVCGVGVRGGLVCFGV